MIGYFLHYFPVVCKTGRRKISKLIQIRCRECGVHFRICRRCYRGQVYCCEECRVKGYRRNHRESQKRYRSKEKGKRQHRQAEKRRRLRRCERDRRNNHKQRKLIATGKDDLKKAKKDILAVFRFQKLVKIKKVGEKAHCHFCGRRGVILQKFPRRGYG